MKIETRLAQIGNGADSTTGAISAPIHQSTTFAHPSLGESTGFDYTRTLNPTRKLLEDAIADLEGGARGLAFASGMAAVHTVLNLFKPGDHLIVSNDLYGGTYRVLEQILRPIGITASYVHTGNLEDIQAVATDSTKALFIETPTNPMMQITDLATCSALAQARGWLTIVDNTFMTPFLQRPIDHGADIVVHSATKYLGGHNDVLAGLVVAATPELGERLYFLQNSIGAVLGPHDAWLLMRGMKTLALRMERHMQNAYAIAGWLDARDDIPRVYYPGLDHHEGRAVCARQASGFGGMVSFDVLDSRMVPYILEHLELITFAESLGGVESLMTYPARQTHFDIPEEVRNAIGVTDRLLRLSVGIEHIGDLIDDLAAALDYASDRVLAHARS
ncbi:trans-sulfuration enzyme family protein [Alicyclobacillus fastidiosus]|uniref:Aminotransferase class I/II-fold pyridoxal phosphate-dependent enzyme n=1 Tax=Alicyclobacillus fastidiosus TaxID=392011 RepID=A0ABV5ADB3_9BACL|nr:aminotransferase class I/II-fold pyridoxal phosphate-dependent enzyme [Alicyclobacillus fastidiosus]WEH08712.1 aminotransferase class I/II-fold pyridoxal phosphate-dependent enzyme [Alicyclobacillus fastidiosus]